MIRMKARHAAVVAGLALGAMSGTAKAAPVVFNYSGGFQSYTISTTGTYYLFAAGAQGGDSAGGTSGGLGAAISADFNLTAGQVLSIAVGGAGQGNGDFVNGGGGGGGTFFVLTNSTPLLVAGGGGGARDGAGNGGAGQIGAMGGASSDGHVGGVNGNGGSTGNGGSGGGGAGFFGNGSGGTIDGGNGGSSFANGLSGGRYAPIAGGFGGGGGGGVNGGGGGGGYSGGAGAADFGTAGGGGGGGSYVNFNYAILNTDVAFSGAQSGNGFATLDLVQATMSTLPLPSSAPLFGAALLALGAAGYAAKRKKAAAA